MDSTKKNVIDVSRRPTGNARQVLLDSALLVAVQVILLTAALWNNPWIINPDGVAYMRIASYYATGQIGLAANGYWGAMLSWLMAPLIKLGLTPSDAARVVLGFSATVFLLGSTALLRRLKLPRWTVALCSWTLMLASIRWAAELITPDLLVGGLMALALSELLSESWIQSKSGPIRAGVWWGIAYLAKAIAFPMCFLASTSVAGLWFLTQRAGCRQILRQLSLTFGVALVISAPWITVLSLKYHHITFSTTGKISHALWGPNDMERGNPLGTTFHRPDPGRITQWEEPSTMPFRYWSPFESASYARHQLTIMGRDALNIAFVLRYFDFVGFGVAALVLCLVGRGSVRERFTRDKWRWAAVPVVCLAALYVPVSPGEERFFYLAFGLMEAAAIEAAFAFITAGRLRKLCIALVATCFAGPAILSVYFVTAGYSQVLPERVVDIATRLKTHGYSGPIAGSGSISGCRTGMFIAFLMGEQWFGDQRQPTSDSFKASGAKLILVRRDQPIAAQLAGNPAFKDLDGTLFDSPETAQKSPLKVFEVQTEPKS